MKIILSVLISLVGLLHFGFMALEMYFWDKPLGRKIFKLTPEKAQATKVLAMNQGLYNGFLAVGLFWSVYSQDFGTQLFFLICVIIAGIFGAMTVSRSILYVQALPAVVGLLVLILSRFS